MGPTAGWGWPVPAIHSPRRYRMTQVDTCSNLSLFSLASSKGVQRYIHVSHVRGYARATSKTYTRYNTRVKVYNVFTRNRDNCKGTRQHGE